VTAREQRTVRWGGLAAGVILLYVLVLDPFLARNAETQALIEQREIQLARLSSLQSSLPRYRERLARAQQIWDSDVAPRLLAGDVPAVAASALSEEVRRIAAQSFLEIERENVLPTVDETGLTGIPVQFSLRGDIYGLRDFLAALESAPSFLHLRELRVNSVSGGFANVATPGGPLQVTVTVEGYLRGTETGAAPLPNPAAESTAPGTSSLGGNAQNVPRSANSAVAPGRVGGRPSDSLSTGALPPAGPGVADLGSRVDSATATNVAPSKAAPGANPGAAPGANPGAAPGANPGAAPGTNSGTAPGAAPGANPGAASGADPGAASETNPGATSGASPQAAPGANPEGNPEAAPGANTEASR
jgi:type II secretory pathway component PulM